MAVVFVFACYCWGCNNQGNCVKMNIGSGPNAEVACQGCGEPIGDLVLQSYEGAWIANTTWVGFEGPWADEWFD